MIRGRLRPLTFLFHKWWGSTQDAIIQSFHCDPSLLGDVCWELNGTYFDNFAVSETKLDANILDDEIKIDGYVSYRLDRNQTWWGFLFYVNNQLASHLLKHLTDSKYGLKCAWIKLSQFSCLWFTGHPPKVQT